MCGARRSWLHLLRFEAYKRDMKIAGPAQFVHEAHQLAIRHGLVCAKENALLLVAGSCPIERPRKRGVGDGIIVERNGQIGFEREKQWYVGARHALSSGGRQVEQYINGRQWGCGTGDD